MKKVILIIVAIIIVVAVGYFAWQSNKQDENNNISKRDGISGFEKPEEKADIAGIVKTIVGNEVTILKIERPEVSNDSDNENTDSGDEKDESEKKTGSGGGMGMGGGMGSRIDTEDEDNDERLEMLKSMSTGEEKVIIPVGIKMLKSADGEAVVATLDNITKDQMLMIWIDETITDKNIATFVMIK